MTSARARTAGALVCFLLGSFVASCGIDERGGGASELDAALDRDAGDDVQKPEDAGTDEADTDASDAGEDAGNDADATADAEPDADAADAPPACKGTALGGHCWYASGEGQSCGELCLAHGGCDLAGTRDFAGSAGTDANCVLVLNALGFASYPHQNYSNNDLGCHYAWHSWTYWSQAMPTTCEAAAPSASAVRMCACNE